MIEFDFRKADPKGSGCFQRGKKRKMGLVLLGASLAGLALLASFWVLPSAPLRPSPQSSALDTSEPAGPLPGEASHRVIEGKVKEGSSFFKSLAEKKIPVHWIEMIISRLKPHVNFRKIRGGAYQLIMDVKGQLVRFVFEAGPTEVYEVEKEGQTYIVQKKDISLRTALVKVVGEIRSSLFEAMDVAGEQDPLTLSFAEILASEIDFYKDLKEGDRFKIVVEKCYKGNEFIRYGVIHAVEYQKPEKTILGIRYQGDYYDEKGNSLKKPLLKAPLRFNRISSRFSRARNHPILGGLRPHYGVDYAAPSGTPIWAVGDGTVLSCGWSGGFGNQVVLRHGNGYVTCYGHLSRYGSGIRRGARVKQKQVIGFVGSTGLSTGPHLDYRIMKEGKYRNPLKEIFPPGAPLRAGEAGRFQAIRDEALSFLQGDEPSERSL